MTILAIMPARGGSKRLPGKNTRRFGNDKTLLDLTQAAIAESGVALTPILTTDDPAIAEAGRRLGWEVPFLRPAELAADDTPTLPVVLHALNWYREQHADPEFIMLLQVTSPLRRGKHIAEAVAAILADPNCDAVVGVRRLSVPSKYVYSVVSGENYLSPIVQGGESAPVFVPNGAIYVIRTKALRREGSFFPARTRSYEMDVAASLDIDTEADWCLAEAMLISGPECHRV